MSLVAIYDCDEWKTRSSLRLIMVSDIETLNSNLAAIKEARDYSDEEMETYVFTDEITLNKFA